MNKEKLTEAVECFPHLWQVSSKSYVDAHVRTKFLENVATQVKSIC